MVKKSGLFLLAIFASLFFISNPALSIADNLPPLTGPETAKKFATFRKQVGRDFLLPQVFQHHPGVTYFLSHATDLSLSDKQIQKLKVIRRKMIDRSLSQMKTIDKLRDQYLAMAGKPTPPVGKLSHMLNRIASLMARATVDHLAGHLKAARVLTREQRIKLASLK